MAFVGYTENLTIPSMLFSKKYVLNSSKIQTFTIYNIPQAALIKDKLVINTMRCEYLWEEDNNDSKPFLHGKMT